MRVKKVFNNNVVLVKDSAGVERVVMGKGIGYNKFPKDPIDQKKIEKQFLFDNQESLGSFQTLVNKIPLEHMELASELIELGKRELEFKLNDSILITLSDHISYMLQRMKKGLVFSNPLQWEIRQIYPEEYAFGEKAVTYLREKTGEEIPDSEVSFIALHFANAHLETKNMEETMLMTKIIDGVLDVIKYHYGQKLDDHSFEYNRFIAHLRYFVKRQLKGEVVNTDASLISLIKLKYDNHYQCSVKIKNYLETTYKWEIQEDELLYLTLHLIRLTFKA